jgi:cysteine desulfurase
MKTIYLDHAAGTPIREEVLEVMGIVQASIFGNSSSIHHVGRDALELLTNARDRVANALAVTAEEIVFTGSATEANNLALYGVLKKQKEKRHLIVSAIEHPSILGVADKLREDGYVVDYAPVDTYGVVDTEALMSLVRPDTALISLMYANNEIGTIQPVADVCARIKSRFPRDERPLVHTDACQAGGLLSIFPHTLGVDLMTLNGSKMYGPRGVGMLYIRDGVAITPHTHGGHQENGRRAGTENIPAIVGFGEALTHAVREQQYEAMRLTLLRDQFRELLKKSTPSAHLNGHPSLCLPNNIHLTIPYIEGESLVLMLDRYDICAATGSACTAHDLTPSHVLRAIGIDPRNIHGSVRFTLGRTTTEDDIRTVATLLPLCVNRLLSISALTSYAR